ncbi:MAG: DNA recombination protein RmuC [Chitinophagaceae bacterium]|nr:MAG: DNA recombination protein RmuC [Chitinophagaceae bacterium]
MDTILFVVLAFLAGFGLAWLVKRTPPVDNSAMISELSGLRTQLELAKQDRAELIANAAKLADSLAAETRELRLSDVKVAELSTRNEHREHELGTLRSELGELNARLQHADAESGRTNRLLHQAELELKHRVEQLELNKKELDNIGNRFSREFELLAQKVLDDKTERFDKHQEKSLADILNPLKENITQFKTDFETRYNNESADRISLREQIRHMLELNQTLSTQANNLTNALRGQVKQQGNWGEMILESILEYADLQKGIHYFPQEHTIGADGEKLYPDIIVRYPDERSIVIDSKVSLLNYEQYSSATEPAAQELSLKLLLTSVYRHIDGLSGKKYQEAVGALDFVLLFVPVEGAYITMMQADRELWQYAYKKRVMLISPTNLIAAMKLVYDLWKREGINQNAQEIAEKAVKIYEKLASFLEDFEKVGAQLDKAGSTFRDAYKKLHSGKGNLIGQAMQMKKKLGHNKPARSLPAGLEERAAAEEEQEDLRQDGNDAQQGAGLSSETMP